MQFKLLHFLTMICKKLCRIVCYRSGIVKAFSSSRLLYSVPSFSHLISINCTTIYNVTQCCISICEAVHTHTRTHTDAHMHAHMHTCTHTCTHTDTHKHTHTHVHTHTHTHTHRNNYSNKRKCKFSITFVACINY